MPDLIVASFFAPRFEKWTGCDYDALLQLLDRSCRRLGLRHVVLSDSERPGVETYRCALPENLMQAVLEAQRQFLASTPGPILFVGADCLLTRDPRPFLAGDVTVTIGPFSDCEMNTGAIWCADGPRAAPTWQAALDRRPVDWGDDQRMLYAALQASDLDVVKLRCEQHNWAPADVEDDARFPTIVHFRGPRKSFMPAWWARFEPALPA